MVEREIGGYFALEQFKNREYYADLLALNTARNALLYLLKAKKITKLYIPRFLCDSVSRLLEKENYAYEYYAIDAKFLPIFQAQLSATEYIYVINYFGQLTNKRIAQLQKKHKNIIVDNVQAFFQKPLKGVDTIYSCRKFFGVADGAYLSTDATLNEKLPFDVSKDRTSHLLGRFEGNASEYYFAFKENDKSFVNTPLKLMSKLTHNILGAIDYSFARKKRNKNYRILAKNLGDYNALSLRVPNGAYCYPFYCENGMQIKKELANKKIYVPTLWPNVLELTDTLEKEYAENILPLPCDQRYNKEDMFEMIMQIKRLLKETKYE